MLPPVLEVYVVWHPGDAAGCGIATEIVEHFHGTTFTGLIGGAVEVFVRSEGWRAADDAPRAIPTPGVDPPNNLAPARFIGVVPVLGNELAAAVQNGSPWQAFLQGIVDAQRRAREQVGVFPYRLHARATQGTALGALVGGFQTIAANPPELPDDTAHDLRCRDLSQALAQCDGRSSEAA